MQHLGLLGRQCCSHTCCDHAGAVPKDDLGGDFLSSSGLVTSSEEYYPTVAINALMRALRDPAMSSHHSQVVRSLFAIFQALQLAAVPFLPKARCHPCATPLQTSSASGAGSKLGHLHRVALPQLCCTFLNGFQYWAPYHHATDAAGLQVRLELQDALGPEV